MKQHQFTLEKIPLEPTNQRLTNIAGLGTVLELFSESLISQGFESCLPKRVNSRSIGSYGLALVQIASFIAGYDCLDDLEKLRIDPYFKALFKGKSVAPSTMGDFLRHFKDQHFSNLNSYLPKMNHKIWNHWKNTLGDKYSDEPIHLSIDSTSHVQQGVKMQGVAWNYKEEWCLDSLEIFDQMGLCHGFELRPGNTFSSYNAPHMIRSAFKDKKFAEEAYLSGDSAFCNQDNILTCLSLGVKFTCTAHQANTGWEDHIGEIHNWKKWEYSNEELEIAVIKKIVLPEVEVGSFHWRPAWSEGKLCFPVVVKRTPKGSTQRELFSDNQWYYYGVVTNMSLFKFTAQQVIEKHNKRANCENFIREEKYGLDLLHFPCLKLKANFAFGLLAQVAHNIIRWVAILDMPFKPHFAKKIRNKFINAPGKLVSHAKQLTLNFVLPETSFTLYTGHIVYTFPSDKEGYPWFGGSVIKWTKSSSLLRGISKAKKWLRYAGSLESLDPLGTS